MQKGRESQAISIHKSEVKSTIKGRTTGHAEDVIIGTASTIARPARGKYMPGVNQAQYANYAFDHMSHQNMGGPPSS